MVHQDKPPLEDVLMHYGIKRRSGRYPWGSGENGYQHSGDFYARVQELRKAGFTFTDEKGKTLTGDNAIAASMGLSTTQFRSAVGIARNEQRAIKVATAKDLAAKGLGATEIGKRMGINESSVRSLLKEDSEIKMTEAQKTADYLRSQVDKKIMVDVGVGVEHELNISAAKMEQALGILEMEGYHVYSNRVPQINNPTKQTTLKVLTTPDKKLRDIYNYGEIKSVTDYISKDGGETFEKKFNYPASMDSKRLQIRYKEDGGIDKEGNITRDPSRILETHQVLPIGYWKGSGLSLVLDLIASSLSGGTYSRGVGELPAETSLSQLFIVFDLSSMPDRKHIEEEIGLTLADIDSSTPVKEGSSVHYPGEGMMKTRQESMSIGVFADDSLWKTVQEL